MKKEIINCLQSEDRQDIILGLTLLQNDFKEVKKRAKIFSQSDLYVCYDIVYTYTFFIKFVGKNNNLNIKNRIHIGSTWILLGSWNDKTKFINFWYRASREQRLKHIVNTLLDNLK